MCILKAKNANQMSDVEQDVGSDVGWVAMQCPL